MQNIIGHKNIVNFLEKSVENDSVAHAYLFYGAKKLGKRTIAENFSEILLQKSISNHPDIHFVERGYGEKEEKLTKNISIEQIRELTRKLSLSSFLNSYKIGIIKEAELLSIEAANSLLKTLEEPTPRTVIILLTSNINALPLTIISRCQVFKFFPVADEEIYKHLIDLGANRDEARNLAGVSWGKPGLAIDFWKNKDEDREASFLNYKKMVAGLISSMKGKTFPEKMAFFENIFKEKKDTQELVNTLDELFNIWLALLRDIAFFRNGCGELASNYFFEDDLKKITNNFSDSLLFNFSKEIRKAGKYLRDNFNPRLVVENLMLLF
jgi:DNA polymerase-3 subunit delta'